MNDKKYQGKIQFAIISVVFTLGFLMAADTMAVSAKNNHTRSRRKVVSHRTKLPKKIRSLPVPFSHELSSTMTLSRVDPRNAPGGVPIESERVPIPLPPPPAKSAPSKLPLKPPPTTETPTQTPPPKSPPSDKPKEKVISTPQTAAGAEKPVTDAEKPVTDAEKPVTATTETVASTDMPGYKEIHKMAVSGQREEAKTFATILLRDSPDYHELRVLLARLHAWDKNYKEAEAELTYVLEKKPDYVDARIALIDITLWQKNYAKAIAIADAGLALSPKQPDLMYRKALAYQRWGKLSQSTVVLGELLKAQPNNKAAKELLTKIEQGEIAKPETIGDVPGLPSYKEIQALVKADKREQARQKAFLVLKHKPKYHDVRNLVATTYSWDKQYEKAKEHARMVLADDPDNIDARNVLINIAIWTKDYQRAVELASGGTKIDATNTDFWYYKAVAYARMGNYDAATETLSKLLDLRRDDERALKLLGQIEGRTTRQPYLKGIYKLSGGFAYRTLDDLKSPWRTGNLALTKRTPYGSIIGRVTYVSRFNLTPHVFDATTYQYEIEAYPKLFWNTYLYVDYAYSDWRLNPRNRYAVEWYANLPRGFEVSIGMRYLGFSGSKIHIYTGTFAKYIGNWWISLRPSYREKEEGISQSYRLTIRRYFSDADHYFEIEFSGGNSPDDTITDFFTGAIETLDTGSLQSRGITAEYQFPVTEQLYLNVAAGFRKQVFKRNVRRTKTVAAGFEYHF